MLTTNLSNAEQRRCEIWKGLSEKKILDQKGEHDKPHFILVEFSKYIKSDAQDVSKYKEDSVLTLKKNFFVMKNIVPTCKS